VISFVILSIAAGMFSLGAFGSLTAVYVRDILHMGTYMFGTLGSMVGLGMLVGSFLVVKKAAAVENKAMLITAGLLLCGANIALIAAAGNAVIAVLGCIGIGLSASLLIVPSMTLMQGKVPPEMRGRVSSSSMSLMTLAQGVALLFAGDLASRYGIVPVYYGSAVLLGVIALLGLFRLPRHAT
jgi:DHA3 family macrolide efflux protein-like MFS transporter